MGGTFMADYFDLLSNLELFHGFSKEALAARLSESHYRVLRFNAGQVIHLQHETCRHLDIILAGQVFVQKLDVTGHVLTVEDLTAGDSIGASLLFSSRNTYPLSIVAKTDTVLFRLAKKEIEKLSQENSDFLRALLRTISDRTLMLTERIDAISLKTIREKISDYLRLEYSIQKRLTLTLPLSKKQLAERFGIQRTSLSRELDKMRKDGLISFRNRDITLEDNDYFRI